MEKPKAMEPKAKVKALAMEWSLNRNSRIGTPNAGLQTNNGMGLHVAGAAGMQSVLPVPFRPLHI